MERFPTADRRQSRKPAHGVRSRTSGRARFGGEQTVNERTIGILMDPQRAVTSGKPHVVRYFPEGLAAMLVALLAFLSFFALTVSFAIVDARTVYLECDRGSGTCAIRSSCWGFTSSRPVELASIRGTRLDETPAKGGNTYEVVLITTGADTRISNVASQKKAKRALAKAEIDAFLGSPTKETLAVLYDEPDGMGELVLASSLIWIIAARYVSRWARIAVDPSAGVLTVAVVRWPLPPGRTTYPLASVRDAVVTGSREGKTGSFYSVGLVVDGHEQPVPILELKSASRGPADAAVAQIRAALKCVTT
jgi:hypothetical protein